MLVVCVVLVVQIIVVKGTLIGSCLCCFSGADKH